MKYFRRGSRFDFPRLIEVYGMRIILIMGLILFSVGILGCEKRPEEGSSKFSTTIYQAEKYEKDLALIKGICEKKESEWSISKEKCIGIFTRSLKRKLQSGM
jgi:hypothetical protein